MLLSPIIGVHILSVTNTSLCLYLSSTLISQLEIIYKYNYIIRDAIYKADCKYKKLLVQLFVQKAIRYICRYITPRHFLHILHMLLLVFSISFFIALVSTKYSLIWCSEKKSCHSSAGSYRKISHTKHYTREIYNNVTYTIYSIFICYIFRE